MTASELIALAEDSGVFLTISPEGKLRVGGRGSEDFAARYREHLMREKGAILAILRGESTPQVDGDIQQRARLELALALSAKMEQELDPGIPEWLEWAFVSLFYDAMEGLVRWGLGDIWPQVQAVAQEEVSGMRHRALVGWARSHRELERHRYSARWGVIDEPWKSRRDELALEAETWAWRAYLLEAALRNPEGDDLQRLDLWVDFRPWALWLSRNGQGNGLVWSDRGAA